MCTYHQSLTCSSSFRLYKSLRDQWNSARGLRSGKRRCSRRWLVARYGDSSSASLRCFLLSVSPPPSLLLNSWCAQSWSMIFPPMVFTNAQPLLHLRKMLYLQFLLILASMTEPCVENPEECSAPGSIFPCCFASRGSSVYFSVFVGDSSSREMIIEFTYFPNPHPRHYSSLHCKIIEVTFGFPVTLRCREGIVGWLSSAYFRSYF